MKRRLVTIAATVVGLIVTGVLVAASIWPVISDVETGKTPQYPELQPQFYSADPARVFDEARAGVEALERFRLIEADPRQGRLEAEADTPVWGLFVDDLTITVAPATEFVTEVQVRSRSRVGEGDFGQNARNIGEFFDELDRRLGAVKFDPTLVGDDEAAED